MQMSNHCSQIMMLRSKLKTKLDNRQIVMLNVICRFVVSTLVFFAGLGFYRTNIVVISILLMIQNFIFSFFNTINSVIPTEMIGDTVDYMEWKTGVRLAGTGQAIQSFVTSFSNALATGFIVVMYMIVNLDVASINANVTANPLEMTHAVRQGMFSLISIVPAISLLLCTVPMFFYNLVGEKKARITRELEERRKAAGTLSE